ncbi:hypothetical protein JVX92_00620 [Microbacterium hominis]|uniref:hypothetical protein n=1 Tax=Microbacterium hominis TaxID=162426 RepID=UPI00196656D3|nr:hypothetical protein [Microbacterium hominis]QRY40832.1 hypothetical protein JVX92_00620 [Microbacterium hominis]
MTQTALAEQVGDIRREADMITAAYLREVKSELAPSAEVFDRYDAKLRELLRKEEGLINARHTQLMQDIESAAQHLRVPVADIRAAQDRALYVNSSDEASILLGRAARLGDSATAFALLERAADQLWTDAMAKYAAHYLDSAPLLAEIQELAALKRDNAARKAHYALTD